MRIEVDQNFLPDLVRFLGESADTLLFPAGEREVEVSILGSRRQEQHDLEVALRLEAWNHAHPGARLRRGERCAARNPAPSGAEDRLAITHPDTFVWG